MADAQIQQELTNIRAIIETMRGDQEKLKERDDMMATRLDQVDKAITSRVTVLEAHVVAGGAARFSDLAVSHGSDPATAARWRSIARACSEATTWARAGRARATPPAGYWVRWGRQAERAQTRCAVHANAENNVFYRGG